MLSEITNFLEKAISSYKFLLTAILALPSYMLITYFDLPEDIPPEILTLFAIGMAGLGAQLLSWLWQKAQSHSGYRKLRKKNKFFSLSFDRLNLRQKAILLNSFLNNSDFIAYSDFEIIDLNISDEVLQSLLDGELLEDVLNMYGIRWNRHFWLWLQQNRKDVRQQLNDQKVYVELSKICREFCLT